ncbi:AraC family transcriptional regulator [Lentilactobacillus parafarraginis]|uniref:Transcriptional regulator, AraC family n=2 Tax=Lentilactobacillus parafarraginis TaxID=390842 RepID=A0A0R1YND8_9LACO|nr:helix-turn-helix domain-containing protein [Lentilactobacillus parafarraginis]KRM43847.1 transcriptional regulator, AraC family [Lentilactobacillus parafarraginis DSM 18390 = JCM 14109]TLQ21210.1 AraC family transcriptional regulator [Lentilactobacillus parafarraginis]
MKFFSFTLKKPVLYYMGGEFQVSESWKHRSLYHKGDYEIIFCNRGPIYIQVGTQQFELRQNQVLIVPPFTHYFGYRENASGADFYWLHFFPQEKVTTFDAEESEVISRLKMNTAGKHDDVTLPIMFDLPDYDDAVVTIHKILAAKKKITYMEKRDFLTSALLIELFDSYVNQHNPDGDAAKIDYIKEWIRSHMANTLNVEEVANCVNLNRDYLTRIFKRQTGMTVLQYINKQRIDVATTLLVRTEMSIKEIAYSSYFTNPKMFMRRFKRETGLSPSEYRSLYSNIHLNNTHVDPFIPVPSRIADTINESVDRKLTTESKSHEPKAPNV